MKKLLTIAAAAFVVVSCTKSKLTDPVPNPAPNPSETPIEFGASAFVDIISKANPTDQNLKTTDTLAIFAFRSVSVPGAQISDAEAALWGGAKNLKYGWDATNSYYKEKAAAGKTAKLFWPASATTTGSEMSFATYFPHVVSATPANALSANLKVYADTVNFALKADLSDQTGKIAKVGDPKLAPNYAFAWDTTQAKVRTVNTVTNKVESVDLLYTYKVVKMTFAIKGDGTTIGDTGAGADKNGAINVDNVVSGVANAKGVKSIKVYAAGMTNGYELNLLKGEVKAGTKLSTNPALDTVYLHPMDVAAVAPDPGNSIVGAPAHVQAIGYFIPVALANLPNGITVEIVYNDGVTDQTYKGTIKKDDSSLASGLKEAHNYAYTLKLGKAGITFTGKVTDWNEVPGGGDIELE